MLWLVDFDIQVINIGGFAMSTGKRVTKNSYHNDKLFLSYHLLRAQAVLRGEIPPPSLIEIDPTDEGCNQACIFCCFDSRPDRRVIKIDINRLLEFVSEAYSYGTYAFELVGGGEPTVHPEIASVVSGIAKLAKPSQERPHIGMVTNGVLLNRIFGVAEYLDFVRVSLDAIDSSTYNRLHGLSSMAGHFERVLANIKTLISIRGGKHVRLGYLVVPPYNHQRNVIRRFIELVQDWGVEHIAFRPSFLKETLDHAVWQEAADAVLEEQSRHRPGFILGGSGGSWEYALEAQNHPVGICRTRPLVLTIKADGTIPSCFLYRERLNERPAIGHISQGFSNIWFSEEHKRSLQLFDRASCPDVCKLFRADRALERLEMITKAGNTIPMVDEAELDDPYFI